MSSEPGSSRVIEVRSEPLIKTNTESSLSRVIEVRADSDDAANPSEVLGGDGETGKNATTHSSTRFRTTPFKGTAGMTTLPISTISGSVPGVSTSVSSPLSVGPKSTAKGLGDEALTQVAQAKFEAQEERLRDVARYSMALLRDYSKMGLADCQKKVTEIRKSLLKYEMQHVCVWDLQERTRRAEIANLQAEAERCRSEAEAEGQKIVECRAALGKERKRRTRYEKYEEMAADINRKKSRAESQASIDCVKADITRLKQQRDDLEDLIERRSGQAHVLREAVVTLRKDLDEVEAQAKLPGTYNGGDVSRGPAGAVTGRTTGGKPLNGSIHVEIVS